MKRFLLASALLTGLFCPARAEAHFVWLVQEAEGGQNRVHVYFSEDAGPDDPELLRKLAGFMVKQVATDGAPRT